MAVDSSSSPLAEPCCMSLQRSKPEHWQSGCPTSIFLHDSTVSRTSMPIPMYVPHVHRYIYCQRPLQVLIFFFSTSHSPPVQRTLDALGRYHSVLTIPQVNSPVERQVFSLLGLPDDPQVPRHAQSEVLRNDDPALPMIVGIIFSPVADANLLIKT